MMYVYSGTCTNFISDKEMKLQAGDLLLYNLQTVHKLVIDDPEAAVFNILIGREVLCGMFLDLMKSEDPLMQFYVHSIYDIPGDQFMIFHLAEEDSTVYPLHDLIIESVRRNAMFDKVMQADFLNLLIRLARLRSHRQTEKSVASKDSMDINEVLTYIHNNYRTVTLQSLSDHYSYTTRSMIRFLKKYTARTFSEIVREYRLLNACGWLKNTDKSIDAIALETGFTERGYFDKVFKTRFRMTPHEFRLNMAGRDII
jgi:AraC-like DNA-binding protein